MICFSMLCVFVGPAIVLQAETEMYFFKVVSLMTRFVLCIEIQLFGQYTSTIIKKYALFF